MKQEVHEFTILNRCVQGENEQLKAQSQKLEEENRKPKSENKKLYKRLINSSPPSQRRRSGRITRIKGGLSILINAVGHS